jgi:hypothetical protein
LLVSSLYDVVCRLLELLVLFGRRDRVEVNAGAPELLGEYDAQGVGYAKCIVMLVPLRRPERVDGWRTAEKGTGLAGGGTAAPPSRIALQMTVECCAANVERAEGARLRG